VNDELRSRPLRNVVRRVPLLVNRPIFPRGDVPIFAFDEVELISRVVGVRGGENAVVAWSSRGKRQDACQRKEKDAREGQIDRD
jgi:hypothetical protein